jgi:hypothetical protein
MLAVCLLKLVSFAMVEFSDVLLCPLAMGFVLHVLGFFYACNLY